MHITPADCIKLVLDQKTRDAKLRIYENRTQKAAFFVAAATLAVAVASGVAFRIWKFDGLAWVALFAMAISMLASAAYQMSNILPEFRRLKNLEREASDPLAKDFDGDIELIHRLSDFDRNHLSYAKAMYTNMAKHIRERSGLLVGALDKVGLLPLAATAYLSYAKAVKEGLTFGAVETIACGVIALFLFAVRMAATAQWMESVAELYAHAMTLRPEKQNA